MDDMPLSSALELDKVSNITTSRTNARPQRRAIAAGKAHAGHPTDSSARVAACEASDTANAGT